MIYWSPFAGDVPQSTTTQSVLLEEWMKFVIGSFTIASTESWSLAKWAQVRQLSLEG